ncbi:hypothetical protein ACWCQ1_28120 [Streptomyces sp. NPDC002144]
MGTKGKVALGAVVGFVVIGVVSANAGANGTGTRPGAPSENKAAFAGYGDFRVGTDIKPGTYRTTGNGDGTCYWERARDTKGETDTVLANEHVTGTSYVTVKPTDGLFVSSGCKEWQAVDTTAKGTPATAMAGDGGMFKVGADIAPGTYRSTGNADDACHWERAKDADHSPGSVIASNKVTGTAVVTINASDAYFKTTGCTAWSKTG